MSTRCLTLAAEAAYLKSVSTHQLPDRAPAWAWADLPPELQDHWRSVVRAVLESVKTLDIKTAAIGAREMSAYPPAWEDFADAFAGAIDHLLSTGEHRG